MKQYLILLLAIICEVVATSALKQTEQFTRLVPSLITLAGYAGAFYFLSMVLRSIPLGIAYAIWSGAGIVLVALVGWLVFKQHLDLPAIIGICMILGGDGYNRREFGYALSDSQPLPLQQNHKHKKEQWKQI